MIRYTVGRLISILLFILITLIFLFQPSLAAGTQFEQGATYQAGAYSLNTARPTTAIGSQQSNVNFH